MDLTEKLKIAYQKIREADKILLVGHTFPDADALSSIGAIIEIVRPLGKDIYAFTSNKPAGAYDFVPNENLVVPQPPEDLRAFDLIFILDCGSISRTGLEERLRNLIAAANEGRIGRRPYIVEFDHHEPQENYADLEVRLADKASTTEIIYQFLKVNDLPITKVLADCVLIGLMTDTGNFLHANSSREALAVSSEMLLSGASLPRIIDKTIHNKSLSALRVWGRALENMNFNPETGLVSSALTASELSDLMTPEEREQQTDVFSDIVSFLSYLAGARVALLLREENGRVKGSLRTNYDDINVAFVARHWGGGGHKKAAGFSLAGRLRQTEKGWNVIKSGNN